MGLQDCLNEHNAAEVTSDSKFLLFSIGILTLRSFSHHVRNPATLRPSCGETAWKEYTETEKEVWGALAVPNSSCLSLPSMAQNIE